MVRAKIQIGTEKRIITGFVSSSVVTVDRAFSTNLVGVSVWNVWSEMFSNIGGVTRISQSNGISRLSIDQNGNVGIVNISFFANGNSSFNNANLGNTTGITAGNFMNSHITVSAPHASGIVRLSTGAGFVEINGGTVGNLRDLKCRSVIVADNTAAASAALVGALRYREDANNSYTEMCVRNGASSYIWKIINQETW